VNDKTLLKDLLMKQIDMVYGKISMQDICEALDNTKTHFLHKFDRDTIIQRLKK